MDYLYQEEVDFYYAQKNNFVPVYEINMLIKHYNEFHKKYCHPKYFLQHLILTDSNVKAAFSELLAEAEKISSHGINPVSQYILAEIYKYKIDPIYQKKIVNIYEAGVKAGFCRSMISLGDIYNRKQDAARAFELYSKASSMGYIPAKAYLGRMYYLGQYVPRSFQKAFQLFKESFCDGEATIAVCGLGNCFLDAKHYGFKSDIAEAERLFKMVADTSIYAMYCLGYIGNYHTHSITDAIYWYEKAANYGDIEAAEHLAKIYSGHRDMTRTIKSSRLELYWQKRAAELKIIKNNIEKSTNENEYLTSLTSKKENEKESKATNFSILSLLFK